VAARCGREEDAMLGNVGKKWKDARRRRLEERAVRYLRTHFSEVLGPDESILDGPNAIDRLFEKYFV
jgi:hypothetical protein